MGNLTSRRRLLAFAGAGGILAAGGHRIRAAQGRPRTASQVLGPFYPRQLPADSDADLTQIRGRTGRAQGQVIYIAGRVLNAAGTPQAGVQIDVWQANAHGRYRHPDDSNPAPLDPEFEGFARLVTDAQGGYRLKTIKPMGYRAGSFDRPPHIHFAITGKVDRLVTQLYFAGEPLNETDGLLAQAGTHRDSLIVTLREPTADLDRGSLLGQWDVVLERG